MAVTHVLLAFGEALAAPEVAWSLRDAGIRTTLLCRAGSRSAARHLRCCDVFDVPAPEEDLDACVQAVADVARATGAALMPLEDAGVLVLDRLHARPAAGMVEPKIGVVREAIPASVRTVATAATGFGDSTTTSTATDGGEGREAFPSQPGDALEAGASSDADHGRLERALDAVRARAAGSPAVDAPTTRRLLLGPTAARATLALDKERQLALAAAAGFAVPPTAVHPDDVDDLGPGPFVVKPLRAVVAEHGRLRRPGGTRVRDAAAARTELERRSRVQPRVPHAVQPALPGTGEGVFGVAIDGDARLLSGHRRVRMVHPAGSGSSACASIDLDPDVVEATRRLCRSVRWTGLFMIELLRDDAGTPWFMELNGRPWGSMALARRRGLDYPALHLRACAAADGDDGARRALDALPIVAEAPHRTCRHLGRELVHLALVLRGPHETDAGASWPSRVRTARDVLLGALRPGRYHADPREPGYVLRDAWATLQSRRRAREHPRDAAPSGRS